MVVRHSLLCAAAIAFAVGLTFIGQALGQYSPVLHERFESEPKEDLDYGVRVTAGALPAALKSGGSVVPIPDPRRPVASKEPTYQEQRSASAANFRIDGQTSDPGKLNYHEPFRPSVAPFKRTHVFDAVNEKFDLVVADGRARPVAMTAGPSPGTDEFFGNLVLSPSGDEPIRIPSVGPGMKVYSANLNPTTAFGFYVDKAENWYVRVPGAKGQLRLVMHVGADHEVFGGPVTATSYSALASELPPVPSLVERVATEVARQLGVTRTLSPADSIAHLVSYFRDFNESREHLEEPPGEALYRALVKTKQGVCRHRAYALVVTALGLGIPARFVHNEAHAWVEIYGGTRWIRVDLGGAASGIDYRGEPPAGKPHVPPADPFRWPKQSQGATNSLSAQNSPNADPNFDTQAPQRNLTGEVTRQGAVESESRRLADPSQERSAPKAPVAGKIVLSVEPSNRVLRGQVLRLSGTVQSSKDGCGSVRVDIALTQSGRRVATMSTTTDKSGHFASQVTVPSDVPLGNYELEATSQETPSCPSASSP